MMQTGVPTSPTFRQITGASVMAGLESGQPLSISTEDSTRLVVEEATTCLMGQLM